MPVSARRIVVGGALSAALAITTPASAQVPTLPLEVRGVRVQSTGPGAVQITFTRDAARLYRRVAGHSLIVTCERVAVGTGPLLLREDRASELERTITAPSRRRPIRLRTRGSSARFDVCKLVGGRFSGSRRNPRFVKALSIEVPATQTGALFLRERNLGDRMVAALDLVAVNGRDGRYPMFSAMADVIPRLVELPSPDATPAPGALGLYSDGAQHVTVAAVSLLGTRLFIDVNGELLSSNVPEVVAGQEN
jgi:hypothetical protein